MNFVAVADVTDVQVKTVSSVKNEAFVKKAIFEIPVGRVVVVYNPFNHQSLMATAILKASHPEYKYASIQEVVPHEVDYVIWVGVKKFLPTINMPFHKNVTHMSFNSDQPVFHQPKQLDIFDKILGKKALTNDQLKDNSLIQFVNGSEPKTDLDYEDLIPVTIIDKILLHFAIDDETRYGYRYISTMAGLWDTDKLTEEEKATFYVNMKIAYSYLQPGSKTELRFVQPSEKNVQEYRSDFYKNYKLLEARTVYHNVATVKGTKNVAVTTVDSLELHYTAKAHFEKNGKSYLHVLHGANGSFLTGNVVLKMGVTYNGVSNFIDC